jgi:hypothetical protein
MVENMAKLSDVPAGLSALETILLSSKICELRSADVTKCSAAGGKLELGPCRLRLLICLGSKKSTMYRDPYENQKQNVDL